MEEHKRPPALAFCHKKLLMDSLCFKVPRYTKNLQRSINTAERLPDFHQSVHTSGVHEREKWGEVKYGIFLQ